MKIAILLPPGADLSWRWRAAELAQQLVNSAQVEQNHQVVIGLPVCPEDDWRQHDAEVRARSPSTVTRHLTWEYVSPDVAERMYPSCSADLSGLKQVALPRDWGWNFADCDCWIVAGDPSLGAVLPVKPVAYYVRDLASRYAPKAFADSISSEFWTRQTEAFRMWRQASMVFASDPATLEDLAGHAGVRRRLLEQCPNLYPGQPNLAQNRAFRPAVLWMAEDNASYDVPSAVEALRIYRAEGGTADIIAAGRTISAINPDESNYIANRHSAGIRRALKGVTFESYSTHRYLDRLASRASIIWSSAIADGENEGLIHAWRSQLPFVGLRYQQNERLAAKLTVPAFFYDAPEPEAIADALCQALGSERVREQAQPDDSHANHWTALIQRLVESH